MNEQFSNLADKNVVIYAPHALEKSFFRNEHIVSCVFLFLDKNTILYQGQIWRHRNSGGHSRYYFKSADYGEISFSEIQKVKEGGGDYVRLSDEPLNTYGFVHKVFVYRHK